MEEEEGKEMMGRKEAAGTSQPRKLFGAVQPTMIGNFFFFFFLRVNSSKLENGPF